MNKKNKKHFFKKISFIIVTFFVSIVSSFFLLDLSLKSINNSKYTSQTTSENNQLNANNKTFGFFSFTNNSKNIKSFGIQENENFNFDESIDLSYCLKPEHGVLNILDYDVDSLMSSIVRHFEYNPEQSPYIGVNNFSTLSINNLKKIVELNIVDANVDSNELIVKIHWKQIPNLTNYSINNQDDAEDGLNLLNNDGIVRDAVFKIKGFISNETNKSLRLSVNPQYDVSRDDNYKNTLPTEFMNNDQLKARLEQEIINNNVQTLFDIKFEYQGLNYVNNENKNIVDSTKNDLTRSTLVSKNWRYTSSNNDPYNISGSLFFDLKYKNFTDDKGQWVGEDGRVFTVVVTGFKSQAQTYVNSSVQLPNSYMSIFAQYAYDNPQYDSSLINLITFQNSPKGNDRTNFFIDNTRTIVVGDKGELVTYIGAREWYNENGVLVTNYSKFWEVRFTGFRKVPGATIINLPADQSIVVDNKNVHVDDVSINDLKSIIFSYIINKPDGFNTNNIIINEKNIIRDSARGEIRVLPALSLYYDSNFYLIRNEQNFPLKQIFIKGFKQVRIKPTTLDNNRLTIKNNQNKSPYQVVNSKPILEQMKLQLIDNFSNLPDDFTTSNIIFTNIKNIDIDGTVIVEGYINYYYDLSTNLIDPSQNKRFDFNDVRFTGFKSVHPTTFTNKISLPMGLVSDISPNDVSDNYVKKLIIENIDLFMNNLPDEFNPDTNLQNIRIDARDSLRGTITIQYTINRFFEIESGAVNFIDETKKVSSGNIEISNFKSITPTKLISPFTVPANLASLVPSTLNNDLIRNLIINPYYSEMFIGLPDDFGISNIIDVSLNSSNNAKGQIVVDLNINKSYLSNGNLSTNLRPFNRLVINGFKEISSTIFEGEVTLKNNFYKDFLPQKITDNNILDIINSDRNLFFKNMPDNFEVVSTSIKSFNNIDGTLEVSVVVKNYYSGINSSINPDNSTYSLKINGFKKIKPTTIIDVLDVSNDPYYSSTLIENVFANQNTTKNFFLFFKDQLLLNLPDDFEYKNINIINMIDNNLKGSVKISLEINKYYKNNLSGELITTSFGSDNTIKKEIEIVGFKESKATAINDNFDIPNNLYIDVLPTEISQKELFDIIWIFRNSIIQNIPSSFTPNDIYFNFKYVYANNLSGSIIVNLEVYKYYDAKTGLLVNTTQGRLEPLTKSITIGGFKKIQGKTSIVSSINANTLFPNGSIPKPSSLDREQILQLLLSTDSIITNTPKGFSVNNMRITQSSMIIDNINGNLSFIVSLNNYYDTNGIWNNNPDRWIEFPVTITNMSTQEPTKILNVIEFLEFKNKQASDLSETQILNILRENSSSIIINPTATFRSTNIESFKIIGTVNNKLGQINGQITIDDFYDKNGFNNRVGEKLYQDVILIGFKTIGKTYVNDIITFEDFQNRLPTEVTSQEIVDKIFANKELIYSNLPSSILKNHFIISIDERINRDGQVKVTIKLFKYYNSDGVLIETINQNDALISQVIVKGFKSIEPTEIVDSFNVLGFHDNLASEVGTPQLLDYVWNNKDLFISNIPPNFDKKNIQISLNKYDNKKGTLTVGISLTSFYNENSQLIDNSIKTKEVLLLGFKKIQSTTVTNSLYLTGFKNVSLDTINNNQLKDIIYRNRDSIFFNTINDTLALDDFDVNIDDKFNKTGTILATINLHKYYDNDGHVVTSSNPLIKNIEITGFRQISPSLISSSIDIKNNQNPNILKKPYDYIISNNSYSLLRELIVILQKELFIGMPDNFEIDKNLIDVIAPNGENINSNFKGELIVYVTFNNYYDENSILQISPITRKVTIFGFNQVAPTRVSKLINNDNDILAKKLPQYISDVELKDFLVSKIGSNDNVFYSLPEQFNEKSIVLVEKLSHDNLKGEIELRIDIKDYYDNNGVFESNKILSTKARINGFLSIKPTKIYQSVVTDERNIVVPIGNQNIEANTFETMTDDQVQIQLNLLTENANKLILNTTDLPGNVETSVKITDYIEKTFNNQNGSILVTGRVYNYIDIRGNFANELSVTFEITGYKIQNTFNYSSNNTAFQYTIYVILGLISIVFIALITFYIFRKKLK